MKAERNEPEKLPSTVAPSRLIHSHEGEAGPHSSLGPLTHRVCYSTEFLTESVRQLLELDLGLRATQIDFIELTSPIP